MKEIEPSLQNNPQANTVINRIDKASKRSTKSTRKQWDLQINKIQFSLPKGQFVGLQLKEQINQLKPIQTKKTHIVHFNDHIDDVYHIYMSIADYLKLATQDPEMVKLVKECLPFLTNEDLSQKSRCTLSQFERYQVKLFKTCLNNSNIILLNRPTAKLKKEEKKSFYKLLYKIKNNKRILRFTGSIILKPDHYTYSFGLMDAWCYQVRKGEKIQSVANY